nr:uncharacterized protein LOC105847886 [Hydra vulgaris]
MFLQSMEEMFNNFLRKMEEQSSRTPSLSMAAAATTLATITTTTSSDTSAAAADLSYEAFIAYRRIHPGPISYGAHWIWVSSDGAALPSFRWGRRRRCGRGLDFDQKYPVI